MSHEGNDKVLDNQRDKEEMIIVTAPPAPMSKKAWNAKEEEERSKAVKENGHYCQDFVCHGMYERDNGSLNDYYYCGKCNELLQVG
tara:strand:+ start:3376 stop:3633 length:258 start_codon:yes stop_codon:yes gene_type:complete